MTAQSDMDGSKTFGKDDISPGHAAQNTGTRSPPHPSRNLVDQSSALCTRCADPVDESPCRGFGRAMPLPLGGEGCGVFEDRRQMGEELFDLRARHNPAPFGL